LEQAHSHELIAQTAKAIFLYCRARTGTKEEAEDLSQDILLALLKSSENLRDDKAFYGFMWAVAGNVYKNWCKAREKAALCGLDENTPDKAMPLCELLENETDVQQLYRELSLLTQQHRTAMVLYYFNRKKVSEISSAMGVSESMVKFLLFKSRKILKEGMTMQRTQGELSFNPRRMWLGFWGSGGNPFFKLCENNLIAQNILLACYNDRCTAEEISVQIGVAVAYLERDLQILCEHGVLAQKGGRYETTVVIFTRDFLEEADCKTLPQQRAIARVVGSFLEKNLAQIKAIGFYQGKNEDNLLKWHIAALLLEQAVFQKYQDSLNIEFPTRLPGCKAFVTGIEDFPERDAVYGNFGTSGLNNARGDLIRFLDFTINGELDHLYFFNRPDRVNVILNIAKGKTKRLSENDKLEALELVNRGFADMAGDELRLKLPVFTAGQFKHLLVIMEPAMREIAEQTRQAMAIATDILVQHTPVHLKKEAEGIGWLNMFSTAITAPVKLMLDDGTLCPAAENSHPTAYVVLK